MHLHEIRDSDSHFIIDPITMTITNPNALKNKLQQGDHNSEIFTFEIPRIVEGHDMTLCNHVRIHYINIETTKANSNKDVYEVLDLKIDEAEPGTVVFSWEISGNATEYTGNLNFRILFACTDEDNNFTYKKWTEIFKGISVGEGFDNAPAVIEKYSDILELWKQDLQNAVTPEKIDDAVSKYLAANPFEETDPTVPEWAKQPTKPKYTASEVGALPATTTIPTALPTPNKLTFSGAVTAEFDGNEAVDVKIPSGGAEVTEAVKITEITATAEMATATYIRVTAEEFPALKEYNTLRIVLDNVSNVSSPWNRLLVNGVNILKNGPSSANGIKYQLRLENGFAFAVSAVTNPSMIPSNPYDVDVGSGVTSLSDAWVRVGEVETVEIGSYTTFIQENAVFSVYGWNE